MKRGKTKHARHRARPESAEFAGELITLYGVADYLNCHPSTVSRLLISGKLRGFHLGSGVRSDWRIFRSDPERWIQQHQAEVEQQHSQTGETASKPEPRDSRRKK